MKRILIPLFVLAIPLITFASNPSSTNYTILTPTISAGGYATSANFSLVGSLSQFIANGFQTSTTFNTHSGFSAYPFVSTPIVSTTADDTSATISWSAANGSLGWAPSGYSVGKSATVGGPYSFTSVGNVLTFVQPGLANGTTYHFVVRVLNAFGNTIATSSEVSTTPVAPPPPPPSGGGGGGGGNGGGGGPIPTISGATVHFSGRAYPGYTVTLLQDARVVASSVSDSNANFKISLSGLSAGSYIFSVYSKDKNGNNSKLLSFPISVTAGATVTVGGIFIAPTIGVDKSEVKRGDTIAIFGQSSPKSTITIVVHSKTPIFLRTAADTSGAYLYNLDTSILAFGNHLAESKSTIANAISSFGPSIGFIVGNQNIAQAKKQTCAIGDFNCDGKVNLIDFSIMMYWYQRPLTGSGLDTDLSGDGKVTLTDFSILVAHWTG